ncbi:hypothetical protein B0H66DRAFT_528417 [Apodospora peruviana]|uniref:Elongator complex protein 6 n=1 Tax=Apodospora peruviana TaxID=516989 RepID=A0AAE0IV33_9PEZI|nr:hypothetical protein B0H66DRAFT_528417 [Apodospora peruviana]
MSSPRTIPPLLDPYLRSIFQRLPEETAALVVATGILGASTNWLVLRYLHSFLKAASPSPHQQSRKPGEESSFPEEKDNTNVTTTTTSVLLLSFLRDYTFWKEGASRVGLDLDALARTGKFAYVDGLSVDLFHGSSSSSSSSSTNSHAPPPSPTADLGGGGRRSVPGVLPRVPVPVIPGRIPVSGRDDWKTAAAAHSINNIAATRVGRAGPGTTKLASPSLKDLGETISKVVEDLQGHAAAAGKKSKVVLVIDQLDFWLAAAGESTSSSELIQLLLDLQEKVDTTILALSADEPLVVAQTTTLEKEHSSFVLSLAHEAMMVLSLRLLDTGVAKDVSGVVRITAGGGVPHGMSIEENEYLYHVGGDGGVKVFERGQ